MSRSVSLSSLCRYEIEIQGQPDPTWMGWFGEAKVDTEVQPDGSKVTRFSDVVMDQAGLVGLIRRLHGLGIVLLSIRQG